VAIKKKKVVVIGGGTGTFTALTGLKKYPLELSAIISMMDDGGSNKVIRDEFGLLPTSDIRQCIVALSQDGKDDLLRKLFTYRYNVGTGITGMTFGNLFMAALTDIYEGDQEKAIQKTSELLHVEGDIIPVTLEKTNLVARYANGKQVLGEHDIDEPPEELGKHRIVELEVFPEVKINKAAIKTIKEADLIVFGPGDFYTSILCNLVIPGVTQALKKSKAKKVFVLNLMTKFGQTYDFTAQDFLLEIEKYLGSGVLDFCLVNKTKKFPAGVLARYKEEKALPVKDDLGKKFEDINIVRSSLISDKVYIKDKGDKLLRSLIRHDSQKLAKVLVGLL
jgi:uncharacterized cofD-like protein